MTPNFIVGVDLGQAQDPTALVVLERGTSSQIGRSQRQVYDGGIPRIEQAAVKLARYDVIHAERMPLGTHYPQQRMRIAELMADSRLRGRAALVIDRTGVGRSVVDEMRRDGLRPIGIGIHGGASVTRVASDFNVPKRDLVGVVQVLLQTERLRFARDLPLLDVLLGELADFRVSISATTGHDSYAAWRVGGHDDLVLALACGLWYAEHEQQRPRPPEARTTSFFRL
jgi:hypothetical protein